MLGSYQGGRSKTNPSYQKGHRCQHKWRTCLQPDRSRRRRSTRVSKETITSTAQLGFSLHLKQRHLRSFVSSRELAQKCVSPKGRRKTEQRPRNTRNRHAEPALSNGRQCSSNLSTCDAPRQDRLGRVRMPAQSGFTRVRRKQLLEQQDGGLTDFYSFPASITVCVVVWYTYIGLRPGVGGLNSNSRTIAIYSICIRMFYVQFQFTRI